MVQALKKKVWHKSWTEDQLNAYVGRFIACRFCYAADEALRPRAASGGSVSALLVYLLESGQIDGALVVQSCVVDGVVRPVFVIARSRAEIQAAQGSKYSAVYFASEGLPLLRAFEGRLAVVLLPCDAKILARTREHDPELDQKIVCVIALTCGHNSEPELTDMVIGKLNRTGSPLTQYVYRFGHWRGQLSATFADGTEVIKPFTVFSNYRNLYFFAQPKCHHCFDHFGYYGDLSAGDIWSPQMKDEPIKHTALISRTETGENLVQAALRDGALVGRDASIEDVANGQARTLPFHYNITARARVGRLFGLHIKDRTETRVRLVDYVLAFIVLLNERVSRTRLGRRLIRLVPQPLIRLYLLVFKGLESI